MQKHEPGLYPSRAVVEDMAVEGFENPDHLIARVCHEAQTATQSVVYYLNVHVANTAWRLGRLKQILQSATVLYCDGAGIKLAAKLTGQHLPTRLTSADWFLHMLNQYAEQGLKVYLLGGEPGVPEAAMAVIREQVPAHSVVGAHHGYLLKDAALEQAVIDDINALQPDIVIVGFGTPLQEFWIEDNRHRLNVPVIFAIGAVMDYISGKVPRCPAWMGDNGMEWLYRLYTEPRRLFGRYVIGNTWFLSRITLVNTWQRLDAVLSRPVWTFKGGLPS